MDLYKKIILTLSAFLILVITTLGFPILSNKLSTYVKSSQDFARTKSVVQEIGKELFASPLRGNDALNTGKLTSVGIISYSNEERKKENLQPLRENELLTQAAQDKLDDMFKQQYFEHISPQGNGPGYLAEHVNYEYIIVGENLALGNFKDDPDIVSAWMESPGHRANIMHTRFQEIGVAVGEGIFNGKKTWLAVQEFGTPASVCPMIETLLKEKIDQEKEFIAQLGKDIDQLRISISSMSRETIQDQQNYNEKISEYNELVVSYDTRSASLGNSIEQYNKQVRSYNMCIKG